MKTGMGNIKVRAAMLLALLLTSVTAMSTTFIKDVKLIGGTKAETAALRTTLEADGWTFINYDLNKGCGETSDFVYLLYKAEENTDGVNWGYITDFYISNEGDEADDSHTVDGRTYYLTPYDGGDHFKEKKGDLNSNTGHGSANIHLYYTKALFPDCRAVTSITFNDTQEGAVGVNGGTTGYDLNKGCGSESAYIYMHFTTATAMAGHQPQASLEACTAGKYQISVSGWAYDPDAPAQSIGVQVNIYQSDGTTLYRTENLTADQANANAGVSGNHGFAATFSNIPAATYKVKVYAIDYNGDGDTQIGATQTVTVTGTQPSGRIDACSGGVGQITVSGWAYDPDATSESIGVQVKVYQSDGTTLYRTESLTADRPRSDVNNTFHITGQHGYSATIDIADAGTYLVKVYAIDTNGDGNPQIGATQTVTVTPVVRLTSMTGEVTLHDGDAITGAGGSNTHVTIAAGATVTLSGVNITGITYFNDWAGITCAGDATIILADGTTNHVRAGDPLYPGIYVAPGSTLTIRGGGTLNASSDGLGSGIGSAYNAACGNIVIEGGTINSSSGYVAIGGQDSDSDSGSVTLNGGTVTLSGGDYSGSWIILSNLFIHENVTRVTVYGDIYHSYPHNQLIDIYENHTHIFYPGLVIYESGQRNTVYIANYNDGQTHDVCLRARTLYKDRAWNTLCLPFSISNDRLNSILYGIYLFGARNLSIMELDTEGIYDGHQTGFDSATGTLRLYFKQASSIEAGKPYIIKWESMQYRMGSTYEEDENIESPIFQNVTVTSETPATVTSADGKVSFIGCYDAVNLTGNDRSTLYLSSVTTGNPDIWPYDPTTTSYLYYPSADMKIRACRAYFKLNGIMVSGTDEGGDEGGNGTPGTGGWQPPSPDPDDRILVRSFVLGFGEDDEITSIQNSMFKTQNESWYDLNGRKLDSKPTQSGIYIRNGKKVTVTANN
ncbi:MAG: carbohydrate-binding domain-containing protein [Bacteroidaceae bacterium]|nr:carbohydrate-binding domain-containing protein [Bacteroidaceae bacterium]